MKNWVQVNNRLLELERNPDCDNLDWIREWNSLLSIKMAGILKRNKYEEPKAKKEGEGRKKKTAKTVDEGTIPKDLERKTSLQ